MSASDSDTSSGKSVRFEPDALLSIVICLRFSQSVSHHGAADSAGDAANARANALRFQASNYTLVEGRAPEQMDGWPDPDAVRLIPYLKPVETWRESLFADIDAGLTTCRAGIAETGSLVLWPTPQEPRLMSLVPPIHVCLLEADLIYSTFAELMAVQGWARGMPTNALAITGPSKSADIEQTLTYGVHGPKELIVLVVAPGTVADP